MNFSQAAANKKRKPDKVLSDIVGKEPRLRSEILKDFWGYIKRQGLQDSDRRVVNADRTLQPVLGGQKQVSIFMVGDLVDKHMK